MQLDKDVIARAVARDKDAFATIYFDLSPQVFRYVAYLLGNRSEAEDVTSEVFLRAWEAIHRYEDRGLALSSWLMRIAHNVTLKHIKRRRLSVSVDAVDIWTDERHSPEGVFASGEDAEVLRQAVLRLPDVQKQVIVCRFIHNMSYPEVEAITGKSAGAVRVIQFRALKRLRETLNSRSLHASAALTREIVGMGA